MLTLTQNQAIFAHRKQGHLSSNGQVISVENWAEVRVLFRGEGLSQRAIARRSGISRDTVKDALESEEPSKYERPPVETSFDPVPARVRAMLVDYPGMPTSALSHCVGWLGGESGVCQGFWTNSGLIFSGFRPPSG
jgi:hypothetical protein